MSGGAAVTSKRPSGLFRHIEDLQGDQPWGTFLDAGTGLHSMGWISQLSTERWT
ncbi:MAG: class I SAM-dependent methyltransferase, partial [Pseudomonadota bacterium]